MYLNIYLEIHFNFFVGLIFVVDFRVLPFFSTFLLSIHNSGVMYRWENPYLLARVPSTTFSPFMYEFWYWKNFIRTFLTGSCEKKKKFLRAKWACNQFDVGISCPSSSHFLLKIRLLVFEFWAFLAPFCSRCLKNTSYYLSTSAIKEVWSFVTRSECALLEKNRHCCMPSRWARKQQHKTNYLIYSFPSMYSPRVVYWVLYINSHFYFEKNSFSA